MVPRQSILLSLDDIGHMPWKLSTLICHCDPQVSALGWLTYPRQCLDMEVDATIDLCTPF